MKFTLHLSYEEVQVMTHIWEAGLRNTLPFSSVELWNTFSWTWFIFHTESFSESTKIKLQMQAHSVQCCDPPENTTHSATGCSCYLPVIAGVKTDLSASEHPHPGWYSENLCLISFFLKSRHMQGPPQNVSAFPNIKELAKHKRLWSQHEVIPSCAHFLFPKDVTIW